MTKEDDIGPHWSEPYGCCFGQCDTVFSVAFREYHGLEEAHQAWLLQIKEETKIATHAYLKKYQHALPSKRGRLQLLRQLFDQHLTPYMVPRRLRMQIFEGDTLEEQLAKQTPPEEWPYV